MQNPTDVKNPTDVTGLEIVVPEVLVSDEQLTRWQMMEDTMYAGQAACEPCACVCGAVGGAACVCLMICAQAKDDDRPATRHDVINAPTIRRNEARQQEAAGNAGVILGAGLARISGAVLGGLVGLFRAPILHAREDNQRSNLICGLDRKKLEERPEICSGFKFC